MKSIVKFELKTVDFRQVFQSRSCVVVLGGIAACCHMHERSIGEVFPYKDMFKADIDKLRYNVDAERIKL